VAKLLPPITLRGTSYRVLFLGGARGPRFLLRSDSGTLLGLYPRPAEPTRLYAASLVPDAKPNDPLARVDFFDDGGKLLVVEPRRSG